MEIRLHAASVRKGFHAGLFILAKILFLSVGKVTKVNTQDGVVDIRTHDSFSNSNACSISSF